VRLPIGLTEEQAIQKARDLFRLAREEDGVYDKAAAFDTLAGGCEKICGLFLGAPTCPSKWRRLVALAVYAPLRAGETCVLRWDDLDLEHEVTHVHRAINRESGEEKETKGAHDRRVLIGAPLLPLLRGLHKETGGGSNGRPPPRPSGPRIVSDSFLAREGARGFFGGADGTRTRGLRRDRPAL
jgi:integrase